MGELENGEDLARICRGMEVRRREEEEEGRVDDGLGYRKRAAGEAKRIRAETFWDRSVPTLHEASGFERGDTKDAERRGGGTGETTGPLTTDHGTGERWPQKGAKRILTDPPSRSYGEASG